VVGEERPPGLRGLGTPFRDQPGDSALGHVETELQEIAVDATSKGRSRRRWSSTVVIESEIVAISEPTDQALDRRTEYCEGQVPGDPPPSRRTPRAVVGPVVGPVVAGTMIVKV
jgi:hypothetical protein